MEPCRIILADDHVLFREGLKRILREIQDVEIVGEAGDGFELMYLVNSLRPDLVIMDITMPNSRGVENTAGIKRLLPLTKVLILTMHHELEFVKQAISAGADGYLVKEESRTVFLDAIQAIRRGRHYLSPLLSPKLAEMDAGFISNVYLEYREALSAREKQILQLIGDGKPNREIAKILFLSVRTVETHRANLKRKLRIQNNADLIKYSIMKGFTQI